MITCHRYDEPVDWGEFCELGAFHSIRLPMAETEVRQSLGFVWEAEKRRETMRKDRIGYGTGHVDFGLGAVARGAGAGVGANA